MEKPIKFKTHYDSQYGQLLDQLPKMRLIDFPDSGLVEAHKSRKRTYSAMLKESNNYPHAEEAYLQPPSAKHQRSTNIDSPLRLHQIDYRTTHGFVTTDHQHSLDNELPEDCSEYVETEAEAEAEFVDCGLRQNQPEVREWQGSYFLTFEITLPIRSRALPPQNAEDFVHQSAEGSGGGTTESLDPGMYPDIESIAFNVDVSQMWNDPCKKWNLFTHAAQHLWEVERDQLDWEAAWTRSVQK